MRVKYIIDANGKALSTYRTPTGKSILKDFNQIAKEAQHQLRMALYGKDWQ